MTTFDKFLNAQGEDYEHYLTHIRYGNHIYLPIWLFPCVGACVMSSSLNLFCINRIEDAKVYFKHPILGARLIRTMLTLLSSKNLLKYDNRYDYYDECSTMILHSCATLFYCATNNEVFKRVIDKFYEGEFHELTMVTLGLWSSKIANNFDITYIVNNLYKCRWRQVCIGENEGKNLQLKMPDYGRKIKLIYSTESEKKNIEEYELLCKENVKAVIARIKYIIDNILFLEQHEKKVKQIAETDYYSHGIRCCWLAQARYDKLAAKDSLSRECYQDVVYFSYNSILNMFMAYWMFVVSKMPETRNFEYLVRMSNLKYLFSERHLEFISELENQYISMNFLSKEFIVKLCDNVDYIYSAVSDIITTEIKNRGSVK